VAAAIAGTVDLRGAEDECGDTALRAVRRAIKELASGEVLEIVSDVAEQVFTVRAWARKTGRAVVEESREGKLVRMLVEEAPDG